MSVPDGLLVLLQQGPRHGYQLASEFTAHTAGRWSLNTGQVYTTLERLLRDGFIDEAGVDPDDERRRLYALTAAGIERVETWLMTAPPLPTTQRDELVLRVLLVVATRPHEALGLIDGQRRHLIERLQEVRRAQRSAGEDLLDRIAADAGATRLEADLAWLDLCDERIRVATTTTTEGETR